MLDDVASSRLLKRYQRLAEVMHNLASTLEIAPLLKNIMEVAVDLVEAEEASILLYDHRQHRLSFQSTTNEVALPGLKDMIVPEESIAGWVALNRLPQIVNNVRQDDRHYNTIDEQVHFQTASLIAVPLTAQDKLIGVLEVLNKKRGVFNSEDQEILLALGAQAAVAIENSRLFQQSDLIAEFVHELRTPLTSIYTATTLLQQEQMAESQRLRLAQMANHEAQRMGELVNTFLDLASLESGRVSLLRTRFALLPLVEECAQVIQVRADEKQITIEINIPADLPDLLADRSKIKQVILNLLGNAVKYNRAGGKIWVSAKVVEGELWVAVQDTGVGIPADQMAKLFTKFFRASNIEHQTPGTGLGLSIARKIAEMHGGQVRVESILNAGATFILTLPL